MILKTYFYNFHLNKNVNRQQQLVILCTRKHLIDVYRILNEQIFMA